MDWDIKCSDLKRNPVTAYYQIEYIFKNVWVKVILSEMHSLVKY